MSHRWFLSGRNSYSKLFSPQTLPCFVITYCVTSSFGILSNLHSAQTVEHWIEENTHFPLFIYTCVYVQGSVDEWLCVLVTAIFVYLFLLSPFGLCGVVVLGMSASCHVLGTTE